MRNARLSRLRGRAQACLLATVLALLVPALAFGFALSTTQPTSKTIVKWPTSKIPYFLHPAGSADLSQKESHDQLRAGFQGWMDIPCTGIQFQEGYHCNTALKKCLYDKSGGVGVACASDADCPSAVSLKVLPAGYNTNGRNELVWIETSSWKFGQYVLGVTSPVTYTNGAIAEADIAFNGYHHKWTAKSGEAGWSTQHVLSVAIHEQGHFFGVQHMLGGWDKNDPPTMAPNVHPFGISATLNADDKKAACFLHPKAGGYSCGSDADCPYMNDKDPASKEEYYNAKMVCQQGVCTFGGGTVGGTVDLGGTCTASKECKSGLFCQPFGNQAYCAKYCTTSAQDCPGGFACYGYQNGGGKGACLPGDDEPAPSKKPGEACQSSAQCTTLMCLQGTCRVKCSPSNPVECKAGEEQCSPLPAGGVGACVPADKPPEKLPLGAECEALEECASEMCMKVDIEATVGNCVQKCVAKGTCPDGYACVKQAEGFQACLPGSDKMPAGSECASPGECDTGLCISDGTAQFCSKACQVGNASSCPCGMTCEQTTAGPVCLAGKKLGCLPLGGACAGTDECALGGVCLGGTCKAMCNVLAADDCGPGEGCQRIAAASLVGACTQGGPKQLAEACGGDGECQSLFCDKDVTRHNATHCQKPCEPAQDLCGPGLACNALSEKLGACFLLENLQQGADAGGTVPGTPVTQDGGAGAAGGCSAGGGGAQGLGGLVVGLLGLVVLGWRRRKLA